MVKTVKYKISIIIPIYNAQDTIGRCIDSIINQTIGFSNIELILYDDNSTDNTKKILYKYSKQYDNIILILSDENSGYPSNGRNKGIEIATADYIMFIDADDKYKEDMCETLYNEVNSENADMVACNYEHKDDVSSKTCFNLCRGGISEDDKIIFENNDRFNFVDGFIWNKIYRKSIIAENNIRFPNSMAEDVWFNLYTYAHINKLIYLKNYVGYEWHVKQISLSHSVNYTNIKSYISTLHKLFNKYKDENIECDYNYLFAGKIRTCLGFIYGSEALDNKEQINDILNSIYSFEKEFNFDSSYLPPMFRIANKLILNKRFNLTITYLKTLRFCSNNGFFKRIYRLFN